jgi:hypothetical protein
MASKMSESGLNYNKAAIGREIKKLFMVSVKRRRSSSDWTQIEICYNGIRWKSTTAITRLSDISQLPIVSMNFIPLPSANTQGNVLKLGHFFDETLNNNKMYLEVTFRDDLTWSMTSCNKSLNPKHLGYPNDKFEMTKDSVSSILNSVTKLTFCEGISDCAIPIDNQNVLKVMHSTSKSSFHSISCKQFLSFKQTTKLCISCHKLLKLCQTQTSEIKIKKDTNITNSEPKSVLSNTTNSTQYHETAKSTTNDDVILTELDNSDLKTIMKSVIPECPPKIAQFLQSQQRALTTSKYGNRWSKDIIRVCLSLWCRSPRGYKDLRSSGFLMLPSERLLQIYKNRVHQKAGINRELVHWMRSEAICKNLPPEGFEGGLILDEMSIQSDLQFYSKDGVEYLVGFTDLGEESDLMSSIHTGKHELTLATHVLQFSFLGFTGFRFPLFHYPSVQASASELYLMVWKIIHMLHTFGFTIQYISTDGAATNRDLAKIMLGEFSSLSTTMKIQDVFSPVPKTLYFIMDYSHLMKKIRNNISKSVNKSQSKKCLQHNMKFILWDHFYKAYLWDISNNPFPVHRKLKDEHFNLTSESKMRNHLAEEVLNREMLHLVQCYAESQENSAFLSSTIELLSHTSNLIDNFRDHRPITELSDNRLTQNTNALEWFLQWERDIKQNPNIKDKEKCLISHQTRADITSLIVGFHELCDYKLQQSSSSIIPSRVNSDVIENLFSQQRGIYHGSNTNPTYLDYCRAMNAAILGQPSISRKSNASEVKGAADPVSFSK